MPRRPKRRVERLADALVCAEESLAILHDIDLRSCTAQLRVEIKAAREQLDDARVNLVAAVQADVPRPVPGPRTS